MLRRLHNQPGDRDQRQRRAEEQHLRRRVRILHRERNRKKHEKPVQRGFHRASTQMRRPLPRRNMFRRGVVPSTMLRYALALALPLLAAAQPRSIVPTRFYNSFDHRNEVLARIKPGEAIATKTLDASGYDEN